MYRGVIELITVRNVTREFKQYERFPGIWGSFRGLVTRKYKVHKAVENISFHIEKGEAVGYLGPNGAGKSTMIKMLTGILVPTDGSILVNGGIPYRERKENARNMGVVFGQRSQLWWDLPVIDSFELHRQIYKLPLNKYKQQFNLFMELLSLEEFMGRPVRQLSLGQRMRAEIALALIESRTLRSF